MTSTNGRKKSLILANPSSGDGHGQHLLDDLRSNSRVSAMLGDKLGLADVRQSNVLLTAKDDHWKNELKSFVESNAYDCVITIGGDGTLMDVAAIISNAKAARQPVVLPVPGGRGNDFIRGVSGFISGQGRFWEWVLARIAANEARWSEAPLDLARCNDRVFINMASIGYGGRAVENAHNRKAFWSKSKMVYQIEGALALFESGGGKCEIKVDGQTAYQGEFFGAFVANGQANGNGLYWTKDAQFDDGKIDGIVFPRPGILEMARTISAVKEKKAPAFRFTGFQGKEISLHFDKPTAIELDGDFCGYSLSYGIICLPRALTMAVLKK